jgi:hypothetical protein
MFSPVLNDEDSLVNSMSVHTPKSVNSALRRFGTHIISSLSSCLGFTPMPPGALCEIPWNHFRHSQERFSGSTASDISPGGLRSGPVDFTCLRGFTERSAPEGRLKSQKSSDTHTVSPRAPTPFKSTCLPKPPGAMEIQFRKPSFKYKSGQWLFLQVPAISAFQWHPFTITSCPSDPYVSVHIRQVGDFTKQLAEVLGVTSDEKYAHLDPMGVYEVAMQNGARMPQLKIDGPYGAPAEDVFDNEIAVLIGTGIGVTPWASILKNIWHKRNNPGRTPMRLRRVEFIWVCRDMSSFEWFQALLASLERQQNGEGGDFLRIHTYLTQKLDIDTAQNIVLNSVGTAVDPLTQLRTGTQFGRPDFPKLFTAMRDGIMDQTYISGLEGSLRSTVGVYFCGPSVAARDIKRACKKVTTPEVAFNFWKEHF